MTRGLDIVVSSDSPPRAAPGVDVMDSQPEGAIARWRLERRVGSFDHAYRRDFRRSARSDTSAGVAQANAVPV
jgi:hypothetical protein